MNRFLKPVRTKISPENGPVGRSALSILGGAVDLMIPGTIQCEDGFGFQPGERGLLETRLRKELWRRCEGYQALRDLPSYRVVFRVREKRIICEADVQINGTRCVGLGQGADRDEALSKALRVDTVRALQPWTPF